MAICWLLAIITGISESLVGNKTNTASDTQYGNSSKTIKRIIIKHVWCGGEEHKIRPIEGSSEGGSCLLIYGHWESLRSLRDFWSGFLDIKEAVEENKPTGERQNITIPSIHISIDAMLRPLMKYQEGLPSHFHDEILLLLNLMVFHNESEAWNDPFTKPGNTAVTPTASNKKRINMKLT